VWVAPVQALVIPVNAKAQDYANSTLAALKTAGVRADVDLRDEKLGAKIRDAELLKIPYMLVVGPRDAEAGTVSVRRKGEGDLGAMALPAFLDRISAEIRDKKH
jgi:threonyl-tRNA synthetase